MKRVFLYMVMSLFILNVIAQTNFYENTKTFNENGYTYQCDVPIYKLVTLYNMDNQLTYVDVAYKATGEIFSPKLGEKIDLFKDDLWSKKLSHSIIDNAFSNNEKARVKGRTFSITMCINSETGKVDEVYFEFATFSPYATIPVSVYRKIETELRSKVWFIPTEEGKKLNYIMLSWSDEPEVIPPPKPAEPQWGNDLAVRLESFAPTINYPVGTFYRHKYIYDDMFNYTNETGTNEANIYISGIGKAMLEFTFINQTDRDIEINTSNINVKIDKYGETIRPTINGMYTYKNGSRIVTPHKVVIPAEGGSISLVLDFEDILHGSPWNRETWDLKFYLYYGDKSMLRHIIDERYDWTWEDNIVAEWYTEGYIMVRYMYNTNRQEMYYNITTGEYFN